MSDDMKAGPSIGALHEVRGRFNSSDRMADAIKRLSLAGFDRADISLPEASPPVERSTPASGAKPADTDADAQVARTLHTSGAASVAALAAAGITIATGGAAAPAIAAAVGAGAVAGGATYAATAAADDGEQRERDASAAAGELLLSVRIAEPARRVRAESILREAGAVDIQAV